MYSLCISFVLLSAAVYTNAAVALYKAQAKPPELSNQEGCYLEHLQKVIPYGDYYPEKYCHKYTCDSDNITQTFTCGVVKVDKRCQLVSNEQADYPDCCPYEMCGTIAPEYLTGRPDNTEEDNETQGRTGPPVSDQTIKEEGRTDPSVFEVTSETLESGTNEVQLLEHERLLNELLFVHGPG